MTHGGFGKVTAEIFKRHPVKNGKIWQKLKQPVSTGISKEMRTGMFGNNPQKTTSTILVMIIKITK